MNDLDQEIFEMKRGGASLRKISQAVRMTHEGVRKRLIGLEDMSRTSTNPENRKLTVPIIKKDRVPTGSNVQKSRASRKRKHTVNRVSTLKAPSHTLAEGVNSPKTLAVQPTEGKKGCSHGVSSHIKPT